MCTSLYQSVLLLVISAYVVEIESLFRSDFIPEESVPFSFTTMQALGRKGSGEAELIRSYTSCYFKQLRTTRKSMVLWFGSGYHGQEGPWPRLSESLSGARFSF